MGNIASTDSNLLVAGMDRNLRDWLSISIVLGVALITGGLFLLTIPSLYPHHREGILVATASGLGLVVFALVVALNWRRVSNVFHDEPSATTSLPRAIRWPWASLFIASFVALFLEMVLIRYTGSQIRIFAFYKNVPLIAAFLGLGLGCALGGGRPRQLLSLLMWLVPLSVFLSEGALVFTGAVSRMAAIASSEHLLGDAIVESPEALPALAAQIGVGVFCVVIFYALALLFVPLGRLLGDAFERLPRLAAYTVNILGSLVGTGIFLLLGYFWTPPWTWMLIGLLPLLWWIEGRRQLLMASGFIALSTLAVAPSIGETIWSPYQKLVSQPITFRANDTRAEVVAYLVDISDVFYQIMIDLRPSAVARMGDNPFPHYDDAFRSFSTPPERVLIIGSGTGNDVAAAIRAGAAHVDAVDIDPAIVSLGRLHHPEQPYDDARVQVIINDARAAFKHLPAGQYDAVVFGLLDSHTQLSMSSVRLDNYVFTRESFNEARRLLRPGGSIVVTAATFRDWFRQRFVSLLEASCDSPVETRTQRFWITYSCQVNVSTQTRVHPVAITLPTDDWPFLYLPNPAIPWAYTMVVVALVLASIRLVRVHELSPKRFTAYHGHLFFLGAAFLLMEVFAINRLALLFGTTWIVSAVTIMVVLMLIVAANLTLTLTGNLPYGFAYAGLFSSLLVSFAVDTHSFLGQGFVLSVAFGFIVLLPVFFAALVFARSFARAPAAGPAIGANMLGAVIGGWAEYSTMALGIRALALLALAFYLGSLVCLARAGSTTRGIK
jgi:SAM-dependent methyltransferase